MAVSVDGVGRDLSTEDTDGITGAPHAAAPIAAILISKHELHVVLALLC